MFYILVCIWYGFQSTFTKQKNKSRLMRVFKCQNAKLRCLILSYSYEGTIFIWAMFQPRSQLPNSPWKTSWIVVYHTIPCGIKHTFINTSQRHLFSLSFFFISNFDGLGNEKSYTSSHLSSLWYMGNGQASDPTTHKINLAPSQSY